MPNTGEISADRRPLAQRVGLAIALASLLPLAVAVLALEGTLAVLLDPTLGGAGRNLEILLLLTSAAVAAGSLMLWRAGRTPGPRSSTSIVAPPSAPSERSDEVGAIMGSFSRMLTTVEQQASEIEQFAVRLESAYKELEFTNARLKEFSFKDEVTGLYNRRFFSIRLEEEVSRYRRFNHPVSVLLLDLDGFKAVNDDLGHAAGDDTLREMTDILMKYSRGINVICRYGGDEFAVLLVETSKDGARLYADRIRAVLSTHPFAHGRRLSASFGIAALPEDVNPGADDLIRAADEALYAAKRAGKNRVSVYEDVAATPRVRTGATKAE
jgi:diguanylate cyclase (GGDEF)-like protein